ncbi:unnamed protein product [Caenorhabditis bovis]|uniref:Serpentine receptor class r-10 n=1 Tax=Caenorhabditis bovis TaxID=2654633 RepID=A0A8S1E4X2_9PELO|nr:unnamed protein product [Caenorhabditis bovis]
MYSFNSLRTLLQYIFGVQSILLNTFLMFLIWNRSPKQIGTYKYMMMYISIFEMFYSIIDIIAEPIVHSYRSTLSVLMSTKNSILGREMNKRLLATFCGSYSFSLALFGVHFIYRYGSTRRQTRDRYFESRFAIIWFSIPVFVCIIWVAVCLLLICEWDVMTNFIRNSVLNDYDLLMEDVVYIGAYFYPIDDNGNQYINMKSLYGIIILWTILASSIFCVFYIGLRCYYKISKGMPEMSNLTKKLQTQLFNALVIQTMIPVILMYFPVTALFLVSFFDANFAFAARSTPISIAFYPAIDPLPTIFIVEAYQNAAFVDLSLPLRPGFPTIFPSDPFLFFLFGLTSIVQRSDVFGPYESWLRVPVGVFWSCSSCENKRRYQCKPISHGLSLTITKKKSIYDELRTSSQILFGYISIFLNTYLILVIHYHSSRQLGTYKFMSMYTISIFEMLYAVIDLITTPLIHFYLSSFAILMDIRNSDVSNDVNLILITVYCGLSSSKFFCSSIRENYFAGLFVTVWFAIPVIYDFIWMTMVCTLGRNDDMTASIRQSILDSYGLQMEEVVYVGPHYFRSILESRPFWKKNRPFWNHILLHAFYPIIVLFIEIISSIFCVFYCGIRCYYNISKEMSEIAVMSRRMKKLQKQLFNALVIQTLIPVILMYIPVSLLFLFPAFDLNVTLAANSCAVTISIYPAIDPLPTIFIIDAYRKATLEFMARASKSIVIFGCISSLII